MPPPQGSGDPVPPPRHQTLHAPWRASYMDLLGAQDKAVRTGETAAADGGGGAKGSCFLREYWLNPASDEANHVVVRTGAPASASASASATTRGGLILLNRYPYANGHLLVCLGEGRGRLLDYDQAQRGELWSLVDLAVELAERTLECQGVNVGVNQGIAAGAGVPEHIHVHVVPRWGGDVNFMAVVAGVRVIPGALEAMAARYRATWRLIAGGAEGRA